MFTLSFDKKHRVLRSTFSGIFSSDDIKASDLATLAFTALHGPSRGLIDFSNTEVMGVPVSKLLERSLQPQMTPGRERVMVLPQNDWTVLAQRFGEQQRLGGSRPPVVVSSVDEAYFILGLVDPCFEEVSL